MHRKQSINKANFILKASYWQYPKMACENEKKRHVCTGIVDKRRLEYSRIYMTIAKQDAQKFIVLLNFIRKEHEASQSFGVEALAARAGYVSCDRKKNKPRSIHLLMARQRSSWPAFGALAVRQLPRTARMEAMEDRGVFRSSCRRRI